MKQPKRNWNSFGKHEVKIEEAEIYKKGGVKIEKDTADRCYFVNNIDIFGGLRKKRGKADCRTTGTGK